MRWPVLSLVGLVVLFFAAEAAARQVSPPGATGLRPWAGPPTQRSDAPVSKRTYPGAASGVDLQPCDEVPGALCGRVFVPLDRDRPSGAEIGIFFAVFPHTDQAAPADGAIF